jgi:hypothetical protein
MMGPSDVGGEDGGDGGQLSTVALQRRPEVEEKKWATCRVTCKCQLVYKKKGKLVENSGQCMYNITSRFLALSPSLILSLYSISKRRSSR